jgi:hypothetical protein
MQAAERNSTRHLRSFEINGEPPSKINPTLNRISTTEEDYTNTTIDNTTTNKEKRVQTKRFKFRIFLVLLSLFVAIHVVTVVGGLQFFFFQSLVHCPPGGPIIQPQHQHNSTILPIILLAPSSSSSSTASPHDVNKKKHLCPTALPINSSNQTNAANSTHSLISGSPYCDDHRYVTTYANSLNGAIGTVTLILSLLLKPVFGSCSDKYGRRPFVIMSACCPLLLCISYQFGDALNSMPPEESGINPLSYAIIGKKFEYIFYVIFFLKKTF